MPSESIRIGVLDISLPVDTSNAIPSLVGITPVVSAITPDDFLYNDVNSGLATTDTYQVILGLMGRDDANKGYTIARCSEGSGLGTITAGQALKITTPLSGLPTFYNEAVAMAVFVKINSGSFQLHGFGYIDDTATDFSYIVDTKPLRASEKFTATLLQSVTTSRTLGSRLPFGTTYETVTPTTGDVTENMPVVTVPVSPNTGADFDIRTVVSNGLSFQLLVNTLKEFTRAVGGNYVKYTHGGVVHEQGHMALNTAKAVIRGNKAIKLTFPPDTNGFQEIKLLIGNLTFNQSELNAAWSKSATTPVSFVFQPAALDRLINNQHTSISYNRLV